MKNSNKITRESFLFHKIHEFILLKVATAGEHEIGERPYVLDEEGAEEDEKTEQEGSLEGEAGQDQAGACSA